MKIYLIIEYFYDEATIHAVETDREKAEKLLKIFSEANAGIYLEEYDTNNYSSLLNGQVPYRVHIKANGEKEVHLCTDEQDFAPGVTELYEGYAVRIYAASKDEACEAAEELLHETEGFPHSETIFP